MENVEISNFMTNRQGRYGTCLACQKTVLWARDRLAAHKRSSCPNTSVQEKRLFAKRKHESSNQSNVQSQSNHVQPPSVTTDSPNQSANSTINQELKNEIDMKLANFFYRTGISFRLVESEAFKDFVMSLNPSYGAVIPCAKTLSGSLLDTQYAQCSAAVNETLDSHTNLTLMSDGWTNIRGDHIVNFCIKAPGQKPFFYTSINTSGIIQNSTAVAAAIIEVIEKIGSQKFSSFISDNANVMKAAWKIIEEKYPHISASGCAAHAVNLLVRDILTTPEASKTVKEADKIIKFVKNHHIVKAKFDERRLAANINQSLSMPVSTRWFSYYNSMSTLQLSKYILIKLADEESNLLKEIQPKPTSATVLTLIKSHSFWDRLAKLVKKIEYPSNIIGKLESDDAPLSRVYYFFGQLYKSYADDKDIQKIVKSRLDFLFTPNVGLAFILTSKYAAEGFYFNEDKVDFITSAFEFAYKINPEIAESVENDMIAFIGEMATLTERRKETIFKMNARNYWSIIGREKYPTLYQIR